ncbi:MAG TPA: acetate--CoA ligase family protein [Tepidiformaceae bacterium]|nr:acetate--CoA ligase family protein [Tepidiformaceae bacterium]
MSRESARAVIAGALARGRTSLTADEAGEICRAYGLPLPAERVASDAASAATAAAAIGFPVALKVLSSQITHKSDAGAIALGLQSEAAVREAFERIVAAARAYDPTATIDGVLVQQMARPGREVIVGAVTDPTFGKVVMFGLGGIFVETFKDVTFALAPTSAERAAAMPGEIQGAAILQGVRGEKPADLAAIAAIIQKVSDLVTDLPEIDELDLNPVIAYDDGALAVDARIALRASEGSGRPRPPRDEVLASMRRIMMPKSIAVIGASNEEGKIGYSVVRNILDGGYQGHLYPVNPRGGEIQGLPAYASVTEIPGEVDVAVFAVPAARVAAALDEAGQKGVAGAILIPSGFAEIGEHQLQDDMIAVARKHNIRVMGPNIYGYYYTPASLCATFCTPYTERGTVALSSQSGGVGMAIIGFSRSHNMGVSAIVGLGNKSDLDEDDLIEYYGEDPNTQVIAMHVEDIKDGRAFVDAASRVSKQKPIVVLKAGRTAYGARAAASHTGALAGADRIYDAALREAGVVRARTLEDLLDWSRALSMLPTPKGENVLIVTGAGGSGVLLSDSCSDYGLTLMEVPGDLGLQFKELIPPFGAYGNPIDITGGEPPETYRRAIRLALMDDRVHSLILGYWHTIITPPMVFATLLGEVLEEARAAGKVKPVVASLVGDVEVEEACRYLEARGVPAYPYAAERPVAALAARYHWARHAGKLG